ncbi:MAG: high-potential iron-sulfur protein, partial [Burkholderiales bacterium]
VDRKKFANYQPGQSCANCTHFQGKANDPWGPCAIFPGKQVAAKGWSSAWVKKA